MQRHQTRADGVPIQWEESGKGPDVVFIHGIPTSPALWRHVIPHLPNARCLAFEMVGYGHSIPAGRDHPIGLAAQAGHLLAWLDAIEVERAVLVGHDLGGGVAQIAAARAPDRCAGLVLTNAVSRDSWPIPSVRLLRATHRLSSRLPGATFDAILGLLLARGHDVRDRVRESFDVHRQPYHAHDGMAALARQTASLDAKDTIEIADELAGLDVPARVVWGAADQFQRVAYGRRLARDLDATMTEIEGGRHFVPEDHPIEVLEAVRGILVGTTAG